MARTSHRRGNMLILLCFMFPVVLAISAYTINVVYMEVARTELQITTDLATRAAGRTYTMTRDRQAAAAAADHMLQLNPFANHTMPFSGTDITFGASTRLAEEERYSFRPSMLANAVKMEGAGKVQVPMLFPTFGIPVDFRPLKSAVCTQAELDVVLVIDRSTSMAYGPNEKAGLLPPLSAPLGWALGQSMPEDARWFDVMAAVDSFLMLLSETVHEEHVALVTYATLAQQDVPLTSNYSQVSAAMKFHSNLFLGGISNTADGIFTGAVALGDRTVARSWATRVMILLTDGNGLLGTDPIQAAQHAAKENVLIYTITFSDEADQEMARQIAKIGLGKHFHATDGFELRDAFDHISRRLPTLLTH